MSSTGKRVVELVRVHDDDNPTQNSGWHGHRDIKDVFPITSKKQVVEDAKEKGLLDVKTFVSGSSMGDNKNENQSIPVDTRPLAEILMEQKEQKQAEFEAGWKTMKTGKNRPLDEDEAAFLDQIVENEVKKQSDIHKKEEEELRAFREAQNQGSVMENNRVEESNMIKRPRISSDSKKPKSMLKKRKVLKMEEDDALNLLGSYGSDSE